MKKLMVAASIAAFTVGAACAATLSPIDCSGPTSVVEKAECPAIVFKLTATGKAVTDMENGAYKTVKTLKVSKGALVLLPNTDCATDGICCYDTANLYATVKIGKETKQLGLEGLKIGKWSIFGKNFEKAINFQSEMKPGKTVSLESDLFVSGEDLDTLDGEDTVSLFASGFGKFNMAVSKVDNNACNFCSAEPAVGTAIWTPKTYSGWFVGGRNIVNDMFSCFNCECGEFDVFGGTWKAVYQAKFETVEAAQKYVFGSKLFDSDENE